MVQKTRKVTRKNSPISGGGAVGVPGVVRGGRGGGGLGGLVGRRVGSLVVGHDGCDLFSSLSDLFFFFSGPRALQESSNRGGVE